MPLNSEYPELNELELACKAMDELICVIGFHGLSLSSMAVTDAMTMIADARSKNTGYPITAWLADRMRERGMLVANESPQT